MILDGSHCNTTGPKALKYLPLNLKAASFFILMLVVLIILCIMYVALLHSHSHSHAHTCCRLFPILLPRDCCRVCLSVCNPLFFSTPLFRCSSGPALFLCSPGTFLSVRHSPFLSSTPLRKTVWVFLLASSCTTSVQVPNRLSFLNLFVDFLPQCLVRDLINPCNCMLLPQLASCCGQCCISLLEQAQSLIF